MSEQESQSSDRGLAQGDRRARAAQQEERLMFSQGLLEYGTFQQRVQEDRQRLAVLAQHYQGVSMTLHNQQAMATAEASTPLLFSPISTQPQGHGLGDAVASLKRKSPEEEEEAAEDSNDRKLQAVACMPELDQNMGRSGGERPVALRPRFSLPPQHTFPAQQELPPTTQSTSLYGFIPEPQQFFGPYGHVQPESAHSPGGGLPEPINAVQSPNGQVLAPMIGNLPPSPIVARLQQISYFLSGGDAPTPQQQDLALRVIEIESRNQLGLAQLQLTHYHACRQFNQREDHHEHDAEQRDVHHEESVKQKDVHHEENVKQKDRHDAEDFEFRKRKQEEHRAHSAIKSAVKRAYLAAIIVSVIALSLVLDYHAKSFGDNFCEYFIYFCPFSSSFLGGVLPSFPSSSWWPSLPQLFGISDSWSEWTSMGIECGFGMIFSLSFAILSVFFSTLIQGELFRQVYSAIFWGLSAYMSFQSPVNREILCAASVLAAVPPLATLVCGQITKSSIDRNEVDSDCINSLRAGFVFLANSVLVIQLVLTAMCIVLFYH